MADMVNHPPHYADHYRVEVIELTQELGFCTGNAVKYILRSPWKGAYIEDLRKAAWYIERQRSRGLDEYYGPEERQLWMSFLGDLAEQGRDNLYRAMLGLMEHDYRAALDALEAEIHEANSR